ncbi:MAG: pyruvate ferredoxin oxidoreductase, partial [Candidatus Sedimenticola endophacoides]
MLKKMPEGDGGVSDIHAFWERTGSFYLSGQGEENLADPYIGMSVFPASTGVYRDMTNIRFEYPDWVAENCTACGNCYSICPDSAIPGLVNTIGEVFGAVIERIERRGTPTLYLRRETRNVEKRLRALLDEAGEAAEVRRLLDQAILEVLNEAQMEGSAQESLEREFGLFVEAIGEFRFAVTKPYYSNKEKKQKNSGGLFSITVNPYTCKGCMECVDVCDDGALVALPQTQEAIDKLRRDWEFWIDLPTTNPQYSRIDDLDEKVGALETMLLDKASYESMNAGDGSCLGCGEKTAVHLFTSTVTALMQPRVKAQVAKIERLIAELDQHIRLRLSASVDLGDVAAVSAAVDASADTDLTLSHLSASLEAGKASAPIDQKWLRWATQLLEKLRYQKWLYTEGKTGRGRAEMGIINSTGCTSVWGST